MVNNPILCKNIEKLGEAYKKEHLGKWEDNKSLLETNWLYATDFFFNHSFMRGRVDIVSLKYYNFTMKTLQKIFGTNSNYSTPVSNLDKYKGSFLEYLKLQEYKSSHGKNIIGNNNIEDFKEKFESNPVINKLITPQTMPELRKNKGICLENDKDLLMVMGYFDLLTSNDIENIYTHVKNMIKDNKIKEVYDELDGISNVGDKLATFIIRDIGLLNEGLIKDNFEYAIPVDTWVMQISYKLGSNVNGSLNNKKREELKEFIIDICNKNKVDPLKFAAGFWVLGYHSLDLLMKNYLDKESSREFIL